MVDALGIVAGVLAIVALVYAGITVLAPPPAPTPVALDMDGRVRSSIERWGSYLGEREWGTPREAVGDNGWGLSWRGAITTPYKYGDDGIAGWSDSDDQFRHGLGLLGRHPGPRNGALQRPVEPGRAGGRADHR